MKEMNSYSSLIIIFFTYALSLGFTAVARNLLQKRALFDQPNERSSHTIPMPRGGGWAVMAVVIPGMIAAGLMRYDLMQYAGLVIGVIALALISWIDDYKEVKARVRLSIHLFTACIGSLCFAPDAMIFSGWLPFWLDRVVMIVGWAWFINLYNFMDGIDGLTGVETISIAIGTCLIITITTINDPFADLLTLLLIGASLGFLAFNWHPARIFLGDVGSVPLGYLTGFLLIMLAVHGQLVPAIILPLYYIADSGITLARRAMRGQKLWQAHREHFYQKAVQAITRHDRVVLWVIAANFGLIISSIISLHYQLLGLALAVVIVAILLGKMHKAGR